MQADEPAALSAGEFARRTGVTLRTLRHYDRLGLLPPRMRGRGGRRYYGTAELVRLQQILTLRWLGFSLADAGRILARPRLDDAELLESQRRLVTGKVEQLQGVLRALGRAHAALKEDRKGLDWGRFIDVIKAVQMETNTDWKKKYFADVPEESRARLKERSSEFTPEMQAKTSAEWDEIHAECERLAHAGADPDGEEARKVAYRYWGKVQEFTQGDPHLEMALRKMYDDWQNFPEDQRPKWDEPTRLFIRAMLTAAGKHKH